MKLRLGLLALVWLSVLGTPASAYFQPQDFTIAAAPLAATTANPILFVTQVPVPSDLLTVATTFGNHRGEPRAVGRGGDLWIRYPDGSLKNLTASAVKGNGSGFQGVNSIAVRDPSVYFDGSKAVFSMVVGAPSGPSSNVPSYFWQMYEVSGFAHISDTVVITPVANQPANYNNVSPFYGTDDRIIFVSDMPHNGLAYLYPTLDEYNMAETTTGLWSLDPLNGSLFQVDHNPSGDFSPSLDSFGRVIFTRWDHLERDQQTDADVLLFHPCRFCTFNYASEAITATKLLTNAEVFPEPRPARTDELAGTNLAGQHMNEFLPWTINEDGTRAETINHIGRHELLFHIPAALTDDPNLKPLNPAAMFNMTRITKFLQMKEDPVHPGTYNGTDVYEGTHAAGQVISMTAPPGLDADHISLNYVTHRETYTVSNSVDANYTGHYRDPLPLSDGQLLASHTWTVGSDFNVGTVANPISRYSFRLTTLGPAGNGYWTAAQTMTLGISKTVSYYITTTLVSYSGLLWEMMPVEVAARARPARITPQLPGIEAQVIADAGVNLAQLQTYLVQNNLALAISRNVTTRDDNDQQQPYRLQVGITGTQTVTGPGKLYSISFLQLFQADQLRGMGGTVNPLPGRRVLAQPLHDLAAMAANIPNPSGPSGSMVLASDGSMAAFVPARRALTWQLTDANGVPVVRERVWVTFQPGEIRVCTSCHGLNDKDQAGNTAPVNPPKALDTLMQYWKAQLASPKLYLPLVGN